MPFTHATNERHNFMENYTEDFTKFGARERNILKDILISWEGYGLPDNFRNEGVRPALNRSSGHVFLVNDGSDCCMLNNGRLEIWHSTPYSGLEGFIMDFLAHIRPGEIPRGDARYIIQAAENEDVVLPDDWARMAEVLSEGE